MKCYFCGALSHFFILKNGYEIYVCPACGMGQTKLGVSYDRFVKDYYQKGYFEGERDKVAYVDYERDKPLIVRNMRRVLSELRNHVHAGTLLDVGCAYGYFLELARQRGFDPYGVEPSHHAARRAQALIGEKRIHNGTFGGSTFSGQQFNVATMLDVFEHLNDPREVLTDTWKMLKDDGLLLIATGDRLSWLPRILGRRWTFYIPPQHLFFFHKELLGALLREQGFEPVSFFRVGKWLSVEYVLHLAETTGESKLAMWLLPLARTLGLASLPLYLPVGDNMVFIARKVAKKA